MVATFVLLAGYAQVFVLNTPLQGSERMVVLADAKRFGVGYHEVRSLWVLARDHSGKMKNTVEGNNSPEVVAMWERECAWRARVWFLLDDAVNCPDMPLGRKLQSLDQLRLMIGDECYAQGIMPTPTPRYRMPVK